MPRIAVPREVLVSADTKRLTEKETETFVFEPAGRRMLKGFAEPVETFAMTRA